MVRRSVLAAVTLLLATGAALTAGYQLAPWKDDLFAYPGIIESRDGGAYVVVDYKEMRDINGRDEIPERRAQPQYVELVFQKNGSWNAGGAPLKYIGAGRIEGGAQAVVIYLHGQGGSRYQGADQWMFGGNFNRIMNLMMRNGGAYLSPDFSDFGTKGSDEIAALVADQAKKSPGAVIFIACGSQGGFLCWQLAADASVVKQLSGMLLLGSNHDDAFLKGPAFKARLPLYLGHGSHDVVFGWEGEAAFYERVRKAAPDYPIRFALFDTGTHGTPIRMTDWRMVLNWMLKTRGR
jgi:hypothetical protein